MDVRETRVLPAATSTHACIRCSMKECFLQESGISYRANAFLPDRPSVVFIHGLTGSSSAWSEYERLFGGQFNLINIDLRGHGNSKKPKRYRAYSIEAHTSAIAASLAGLDPERLIVVSHSFGTLIALDLILKYLKSAQGLVLLSPTYGVERGVRAALIRALVGFASAALSLFPYSGSVRGRTDYSKHVNTGDWNIVRMYEDIRNTSLRVYFFCLSHIYRFKQTGKWEHLSMPTCILHGKSDSLIPLTNALQLHRVLPQSKLITIETGNHIIVLNHVKEIAEAIRELAKAG